MKTLLRTAILACAGVVVLSGCAAKCQLYQPAEARDAQPRTMSVLGNDLAPLRIEVLSFEDCANAPALRANVESAVKSLDIGAEVLHVDQLKLSADDLRRQWPSPTVLVNGRDLFGMARPQNAGISCRTYRDGVPTAKEITAALEAHYNTN